MKTNIKIITLIVIAYIVSVIAIKNIFLASSPKINPHFAQNLITNINFYWSKTSNFFAFKKQVIPTTQPVAQKSDIIKINSLSVEIKEALNTPLSKVSKGIYAGEKNDYKVFEFKTGEIEYLEYIFNIKGKEIKIKVPKGLEPPSQQVVEELYK